ncbi:MAG: endonuclease/exonuclease/phosphatase family protein [Planctomycetota bacterium]|jgi:endonuclease/exonuclease/phosphatase family metal-dependent hydrolase
MGKKKDKKKKLAAIGAVGLVAALFFGYPYFLPEKHVLIATWNVRGYPEKTQERQEWFSEKLIEMSPDVLCVQEIANQERVDGFLESEKHFVSAAFVDSSDGQDNAIFATEWVEMEDAANPEGFQHPAQAAYVGYEGFDCVIVTVHLSWTDTAMREQEKTLLEGVVLKMLEIDPDVIIAGDFNTKEQGIQELAESVGMVVMAPLEQDGTGTTVGNNRYDHFLISPDLANEEAIACEIQTFSEDEIRWEVSDHVPVVAVFDADSKFRDRE